MFRVVILAAGIGVAALTAAPATAEIPAPACVSVGLQCQSFHCQNGYTFDNGFNDTGPWVSICKLK